MKTINETCDFYLNFTDLKVQILIQSQSDITDILFENQFKVRIDK